MFFAFLGVFPSFAFMELITKGNTFAAFATFTVIPYNTRKMEETLVVISSLQAANC